MHPRTRSALALATALLLVATLVPAPSLASPEPQALPPTLQAPGWAVGFSWTYRYVGPYHERIGEGSTYYEASYVNDTYTSRVVGELSTSAGPAWLVRNDHAGAMAGNVTAPIIGTSPATATFTTLTFAAVLKADYAIVNDTQYYNITASGIPIIGTVSGTGYNETQATPPFEQVVWGTAADGTTWRVVTNLTSSGWYQIGSSGQQSTSGYQALDYNLSVVSVMNLTVPAGTFEVYNISGGGTSNTNGNLRAYNQTFYWSPLVQNKVIDEGGYWLLSYDVNRPPVLAGTLPVLNLTAGEGTDFDLTGMFADPDGDPFNITCQAPSGLHCSVGPGDLLNVTADPGINATLNVTLTVDDGRPAGSATFTVRVLVTGAGSTNQPPVALAHGPLTTPEDTPFHFAVADYFSDPDDGIASFTVQPTASVTVVNQTSSGFDLVPLQDFNGDVTFTVDVFDFGGLTNGSTFTLQVTPVNDPPVVSAVGPLTKTMHVEQNLTVSVSASDVDGDPLSYVWQIDGLWAGTGRNLTVLGSLVAPGPHTLGVLVSDGQGGEALLNYTLLAFAGPRITAKEPPAAQLTVGTGADVRFAVSAQDPDSTVLDYRWSLDGSQVLAGADRNNTSISFPAAGDFKVRATVADNGSNDSVEWQVTVVEVPAGLVSIVSPVEGPIVRVDEGGTLPLRASVDGNLSGVSLEWSVDGEVVSNAASFDWPVARSGLYRVELHANATYMATIAYSAADVVNVTVVLVVPPNPGNNGTNGTNNTGNNGTNNTGNNGTNGGGGGPTQEASPDDTLLILLIALVAVAVGAAGYLMYRRGRRPSDGKEP